MRQLNINIIYSVDKAIDILNALTSEKEWLSINEIVNITKFSKPTVYRLLYTMERRGLVRYDAVLSKYKLGYKLLEYGDALLASQDILLESEELLVDLYNNVNQTVLLGAVEGDSLVYIFKRSAKNEGLVYTSTLGKKRDLFYGALGRVVLAFLPDEQVKEMLDTHPLPQWTERSITDKEEMLQELKRVKENKICIEVDQTANGVTGIASPIFGVQGNIIAVLGVLGPSAQLAEQELLKEIKEQVLKTASSISSKMGYKTHYL